MAAELEHQAGSPSFVDLGFEDRLQMLVSAEITERENRRLTRLLKAAKLRSTDVIEDVDFHQPRGLNKADVLRLAQGDWVERHHHLAIVGPTGLQCAFLSRASRPSQCGQESSVISQPPLGQVATASSSHSPQACAVQ